MLNAHRDTNKALLEKREKLQAQIDDWHKARQGQPHDMAEYKAFLHEIGYLVPEGGDFTIETANVDDEIAKIGPQLVVPIKMPVLPSMPPMHVGALYMMRFTALMQLTNRAIYPPPAHIIRSAAAKSLPAPKRCSTKLHRSMTPNMQRLQPIGWLRRH